MNTEIQSSLDEMLHKVCWSTVAGEGTGSIFTLGLGTKIPRKKPSKNLNLTQETRENRSEYGLIVYSSWILSKEDELVCDSNSDNSNDGPLVRGLASLRGTRVTEAIFEDPDQGLSIAFDGGYRLQIACDGRELYGDDSDEFIVYTPSRNLSVTTNRKIEIEPSDGEQ